MKITLFRDLSSEGWPSMDRYADMLLAALRRQGCDARAYVCERPASGVHGAIGALANYAWRSLVYPPAAQAHQGEINHIVDHSYAHLLYALDADRTVVTCHDIAPLDLDQRGRGLSRRLWDRSFRAMLHAAHVVAVSAYTRNAVLRHTGYPAGRITIVPPGVDGAFFVPIDERERNAVRQRYQLVGRPLVLHVGSCQSRKNVEVILEALARIRDLDTVLVQVGGQFSASQQQYIARLQLEARVIQIPRAAERELRAWYQASDVLALPSLYEGFGLPVLEAMASGTPVVCSSATSLPEVAGDAAILIDPRDPLTLAEAIHLVLSDPERAADLRRRGRQRARYFTWERCARETLSVYQQLAELL